jgi:hypothetical protein
MASEMMNLSVPLVSCIKALRRLLLIVPARALAESARGSRWPTLERLSRDDPPRLMVHAHDQQFVGMALVVDSEWPDAPTAHHGARPKA